ncbi:S-adenosyl-L-methionine-dependent methyltransferase [Rhizodiscina lignyota]|uniref:S-adenosyl-L-methionine-dependent methyltransferase n=1 Tax=Rhizodiscina lignyota TaxID=1504668 RepID=A0A9P4IE23_9PEZI|nr:S-adenosyl-L-methionine-dependent methyltransferase [Rhizodiscina lignyota]
MAASSTSLNSQFSAGSSNDGRSVGQVIEPDDSENLSEVGERTEEDSTKSLRDSIFNYIQENGRTYHSYMAGSYMLPNDLAENERLDLAFYVYKVLFGGRNIFAPLNAPIKIMDLGTGTGKWAIEVAREFPNAQVIGTDLSPIQPEWYPANVKFIIDDASEDDWMMPPNSISYIHTRTMLGSFTDFRDVVRKAFRYVEPGGWFESQEVYPSIYCDDGTMPADWPLLRWAKLHDEAAMNMGRPLRIANKLKRWYTEAGFVDVKEEVFKVPINPWPKDPQFKLIGRFHERNMLDGLQGFSLAFFHRGLGWTKEEIEVYLVDVRKALQDKRVHAYQKVYVVWGRKPENITSK